MDKKIETKKHIEELVERFGENIAQYKRPDYDEANTRTDFIDPFFENLGWDVANKQGYAEQYREVVREAKITIAGKQKAPDYSFRIGGIRKFFVEAKKPSVDLKHEISPAYQLKRYAYTAKLPLSILTDFEEFSVYDTRIKPTSKDLASCARIFYCGYKDYLKNFDFIYDTFSKDGLLKGSFDRYIESSRGKRGTSEVDKEFLKLIDKWREGLAKNIALRNKSLSLYELNFAVQKVIDRIIFLRIAEDRQIENYGRLQNLLNGVNTYKRLMEIFLHSDKKYNSGLFDFKKDEITHSLSVDDRIIKEILKSVYYPESPYEFSVLDVEILGNIYEQFLGKTIRLTPAHQVKIEEKPEVKKAGGVYYTPKYIVDYIVKNTVGEIIKDKTPKQIEKLNLLDPACGSGSFLLGAYQELLNYHLDWYSKDKNCKKALKKGQIMQEARLVTGKDSFQLTIAEKQRVLLNNIFGVDIDTQAVEVSKLSLLLKLLEGETEESTGQLFRYTQMKLLPDLSNNIKCGNSLIGPDFYKQMSLLNDDEARRINAFDWESAFPDIFENGGFDVVIGNPPWVFTRDVDFGEEAKRYYQSKYFAGLLSIQDGRTRQSGKINLYAIFLMQGIRLLDSKGKFGFIVPNNILRTTVYDITRKYILDNCCIHQIVDLKSGVFERVTASTVILIFEKNTNNIKNQVEIIDNQRSDKIDIERTSTISQSTFLKNISYAFNIFLSPLEDTIFKKMRDISMNLENSVTVCNGIATKKNKEGLYDRCINAKCKKLLIGKDVHRYYFTFNNRYIEYDRKKLHRARKESIFLAKEKLMMQRIGGILITVYDDNQHYTFNSINNLIAMENCPYDLKFILGLLNSKLMRFYYICNFTNRSTLTVNISKTYLDKLPIRTIDFSNPSEKAMHDRLVAMVERMLELQKKFHSVRLESDKKMYKTQIDVLDNQIDSLVYELYWLTDEEINIIKSGS